MKTIKFLIRIIIAILFIIFQQAFIIGIGLLVYAQSSETFGIVIWFLCLPMLYINYKTYKYVMKFGFIDFITINADTSEIDVKKGKRWYDKET